MEFTLSERAAYLKAARAALRKRISAAAEAATMRAVETAADHTPPSTFDTKARGANTITGELKQSWATDSKVIPTRKGESYVTILANNREYASYVNDGHRMDRHFVPGLVIDRSGLLSKNPDGRGGIIVGTKTAYVKGLFMADKAVETYRKVLKVELDKMTGRDL